MDEWVEIWTAWAHSRHGVDGISSGKGMVVESKEKGPPGSEGMAYERHCKWGGAHKFGGAMWTETESR